jgi:molybdopterin/thiamine biosynthesis adenylyltransferase
VTVIDYWRQVALVRPEDLDFPVTIIGAGGIGSPLALALTKMGCRRMTLYDPDVVEPHNLPNQLYRLRDVGRPKVAALADLLCEFASPDVRPIQDAVTGQTLTGVVISGVDSMEAREQIWRQSIRYRAAIPLYIDARMAAQVCRLLTVRPVDPDDVRWYETTLFADDQALEEPCTAQAIIYTTFGLAGFVANQIKRHAQSEAYDRDLLFDFATLSLLRGGEIGGGR